MADEFNWDIVVRLATQGARQAKGDIEGFSTAVDEMARTGKVSEKAAEAASRATVQQGKAAKSATADIKQMETSVISLRYANYDLATSMLALSAGVTAAGVSVVTAFASQESAFTSVERTAEGSIDGIRDKLTELSTQIPYTFNELANIATLGNQLGIAADDIEAFTETVAQFSTVTGISAEESALAFGKLGNLLGVSAQDYDRLASSIALVGRTTAATEAQIVSVASEIAPAAAAAGFTADQVIGLSGALASLKVPPERSRSTILQFFETLNMAVAEGGDKLANFAQVVGVSASELEAMVRSGQGTDILRRFIGNVSTSDTIQITQALEALGLAGLRTNPTIRALAGNTELLNQAFADGAQGYAENSELQRQMALVLDDLSTKWQTFLNAAMNAAAAIGSSVGPALGVLLDTLKNLLIGLEQFANSDFGQSLFRLVGVIGLLVAAYAGLRGGIALATASLQAFSLISSALGGAGIVAGLRGLASAFGLVTGASAATTAGMHTLPATFSSVGASSTAASRALLVLRNAFLALGKATIVLGLLQAGTSLIFDFGGSMEWLGGVMTNVANIVAGAVQGIVNYIAGMIDVVAQAVPQLKGLADSLRLVANSAPAQVQELFGVNDFKEWAKSLTPAEGALSKFNETANSAQWDDWAGGTDDWGGSLDNLGDSAAGATQEVRTLVDYANDLQSVFSRSFDIRFGGESSLDAITSTFLSIREATEESARNIRSLKAEIQGLQSDLSIQKYFLGIAIEYKDAARAQAIQANIAKLQAEIADKTAQLSDEQQNNSKELTGNSKAALANRKQMEDLVKQYQAHITALAASGLSQSDLAIRTAQLREQFIQQATQLGYSRAQVEKYAAAFDDMRIAIDGIPRNITVTANANPALQALNEFMAKARSQVGSGISVPVTSSFNDEGVRKQARAASLQAQIVGLQLRLARNPADVAAIAEIAKIVAVLNSGNYSSGGFTGRGGKYEPAGVVHRGEYVVPKKDVNQRTGLPYADAMGRLQRGASGPGYAGGGFVRSAPQALGAGGMSLSAMGMQQFQQIMNAALKVYLDGQTISGSSAQQYAHQTAVGAS